VASYAKNYAVEDHPNKNLKLKEINSAILYKENEPIVKLDLPELRIENGLIYIDCYINKDFFGDDREKSIFNKKSVLDNKTFTIQAIESHGSKLTFNQVVVQSESYPSYKFSFYCYDYSTEYINVSNENDILKSGIKYLIVEGVDMLFTKTSEKKRIRTMFGKDDSRMLSLELDNSEIQYNYYDKRRNFDLQIGLIKDSQKEKSILINFYQDKLIPYRIYQKIKPSLKYFISYLCGNNVIIREEYYLSDNQHFTRTYSQSEITEYNINNFLPIHSVHFKHKGIIDDYANTLAHFLAWDKKINLSEVIYLINQSKQVNIESSFFILLIVIEKIANTLYDSGIIDKKNGLIIDDEIFTELKEKILPLIETNLNGKVLKKQVDQLKSKLGNINKLSKTENKIDVLLEFCEIKRTEEIDQLFPRLRNLAIHQGEISYDRKDSSKNYHTLFVLINNIICNLIQYRGIRFIEHKDGTNYIGKKEDYKFDIKKLLPITAIINWDLVVKREI
jgi:hypothetical protein